MSNKNKPGYTKQGVRDLNYLKGKSVGVRLPMPPHEGMNCDHPPAKLRHDHTSGCTHCTKCGQSWDFDGHAI